MQVVKSFIKKVYQPQIAYNINDFPYHRLYAKKEKSSKSKYISLPATFDIETSNVYNADTDDHYAFMYHFQFCIEGFVVFGRTWEEFQFFLGKLIEVYNLSKDLKLVIYVHNLSFEFQFMHNFIDLKNVFATEKRKVLRATTDTFEFRCSYYLSNMNLAKFIENSQGAIHYKGVDDLDYRKLRTPSTILTPIEMGYCYNDVVGLYEAMLSLLKDDTLVSIPMTSTGYVRRDCRLAMRKNRKNRKIFSRSRLSLVTYDLLRECFRGGNTASNRYHTAEIVPNVHSFDISSSYPFVMMTEYFPMGKFMRYSIDTEKELEEMNKEYCTIGTYIFHNIRLKKGIAFPYIPVAKCSALRKEVNYNGRVLSAEYIMISLTNIDYDIINNQYDYEYMTIPVYYFSRKGKLPDELRNVIMYYFRKKTELKGDNRHVYEYQRSKEKLNAIYGMMVTDIIHEKIRFENGVFIDSTDSMDGVTIDRQSELDKYYSNWNNFLPYQWGVFVTAYARKRLQEALDIVGLDGIYCDTDSIKFIGDEHIELIEKLNDEIISGSFDIKPYIEYNSSIKYLGVWDREDDYQKFVTLGAKKYAYIVDNHYGITVSGLNKIRGAIELEEKGGLDYFKIGSVFENSGRTTAYFNDTTDIIKITINGDTFTTSSNVAIFDTTYTLGITDTMLQILEKMKMEEN